MAETQPISRRRVLSGLMLSTALAPNMLGAQSAEPLGTPFSFDGLKRTMQARAALPDTPPDPLDTFSETLTYDDYRNIYFRPDAALWADRESRFQVQAFHPGWLFTEPVRIYEIVDDLARPVAFGTEDFEYRNQVGAKLPQGADLSGAAGVKINTPFNTAQKYDELITFLGASYFRALGAGNSYGLSARGLALNTWQSGPEEFPRFSAFWLRQPSATDSTIEVFAAMDSASLTGAYRFVITPGADTIIDVEAALYFRKTVAHLGLAPLTSMFYFAEHSERRFDDFRPQVHDSELLRMVRTSGDVLVRPLNNPPRVSNSFFTDDDIIEFGLIQRDRSYDAYQDAGAQYHNRPSVMIYRIGDWGPGKIRLVEIPADLEIDDNIVLFWTPDAAPQAGETRHYRYRMHWGALPPDATASLAYVHSTRTGVGGPSGVPVENPNLRKFVIDFEGGDLGRLDPEAKVFPVVSTSAGEIANTVLHKIEDADHRWRLFFDIDGQTHDLIELMAHVADGTRKLSETWLFQWTRTPAPALGD